MERINAVQKIRIMLVDDHLLMRMGLVTAVEDQADMEVVAEAEDGRQAIDLYRVHRPDVVILDLRMPRRNGLDTIGDLRREFGSVRILVLTNYSSGDDVYQAITAGAYGFLSKEMTLDRLLEAIRAVRAEKQYIPPEMSARLNGRLMSQLSQREFEVLSLIAKGLSNKEIGTALHLAESTVKVHVTNIFSKLNVADRTQAALFAIKRGIIQLE